MYAPSHCFRCTDDVIIYINVCQHDQDNLFIDLNSRCKVYTWNTAVPHRFIYYKQHHFNTPQPASTTVILSRGYVPLFKIMNILRTNHTILHFITCICHKSHNLYQFGENVQVTSSLKVNTMMTSSRDTAGQGLYSPKPRYVFDRGRNLYER